MRLMSTGFRATSSIAMLNPLSANRSDLQDLEVALIISGGQLANSAHYLCQRAGCSHRAEYATDCKSCSYRCSVRQRVAVSAARD
jgi:hypothetical protein